MTVNTDPNKKIGAVMVIGSGIAGMQASLDLAESGFKVYLVEELSAIGGRMPQLDKTFPTNECAMCVVSPKIVECGRHLNIEVIPDSEIESIKGEAGNFEITLYKKPRFVDIEKCTGCEECALVCPVEIPSKFDSEIGKHKAIYRLYPQAVPAAFVIEKREEKSPCNVACPAGVNAHGYVSLIRAGKFKEALELVRKRDPFPSICGRVCYHPCEKECLRKEVDEPLAIRALKRFIADYQLKEIKEEPGQKEEKSKSKRYKKNVKKVAIVGAGPAGLTSAYDLIRLGYKVVVYEKLSKPGGMLLTGIPDYRLPKEILEIEIQHLTDLGIEIRTNTPIGEKLTLSDLQNEYQAVFIAIGAYLSRRLGIAGEDMEGVVHGVDFLKEFNLNGRVDIGKRVVIVGGGNVAVDSARTALRLGAEVVTVLYRRSRSEMPASFWEIEEAEREGVKFHFLAAPTKILGENNRVTGMECIRMELGKPDASGRRRPVPIEGTEFEIGADLIIPAVGQSPDLSPLGMNLNKTDWGTIQVDPMTLETSYPGVFAGGDAVTGAATVVDAMAAGHEAAISIDRYIRGQDLREDRKQEKKPITTLPERKFARQERIKIPLIPLEKRRGNFNEVELPLSEEDAVREVQRCLNCGICSECLECEKVCEPQAIMHQMRDERLKINVGGIIITTGVELFDANLKKEYGFDRYKNVLTSIQFERLLSSSGPTQGRLSRPSDGEVPERIAFIQCVGSRDPDYGNEFCSSVCCMYTAKQALIAREHEPEVRVKIFFIDIRAFGKGFERYYETAKANAGIKYQKCMISKVYEMPDTKNLQVRFIDEIGQIQQEEFDMVVLAVGLTDTAHFKKLAEVFGLELNEYGFCKTDRLSPGITNREGIFVAGTAVEPKDIPETVIEGSSAATIASVFLSAERGKLVREKEYPPQIDVSEQDLRIGVFVCRCGRNIASVVDVPQVVEYAARLPEVVYAKEFLYSCSQDSLLELKKEILDNSINRVVVASCTPRTHEELFRDTVREVGLNRYLFEMASIREQVSWVHAQDKERATQKAKELVAMMVGKVRNSYSIEQTAYEVTSKCLVVGGGISGMQASLNLARNGYEVFLVEKEERLGGNLLRLKKNLEGGDLSIFLAKLISQVENQKNIRLFKKSKVKEVTGFLGNFKTKIEELETNHIRELTHGAVIIAIGAKEYKPKEFAYGASPRIITQLELEKEITTIADTSNFRPQTFVMIQCVGSRNEEHPYCSRFCCAQAVKNALELKNLSPQHKVVILYLDMRTFGFSEKFYLEAREKGVLFNRFCQEMPPEVKVMQDGKIRIIYYDTILAEEINIDADWLILTTGVVACQEAKEIRELFKIPTDADGFFMEAHAKIRPVDCSTEGIFLCGLCHSPQFVHESLAQAQAAAARAITILSKKKIESKGIIVKVNERVCKICGVCVSVCPYGAREINEETGVAVVHEILCQGCGACAVACPSGATEHKGFNKNQLMSMVEGSI